jgi:hydroxypyruvate isomerase
MRTDGRLALSANVSILYPGRPFAEAVEDAAARGFRAVEFWDVDDRDEAVTSIRRASVQVAVVNVPAGWRPDDCGRLGDPAAIDWWRDRFAATLLLAERLGRPAINVLAGRRGEAPLDAQQRTVRENLRWALHHADRAGVTLLLEALNRTDRPGYLWPTPHEALAVIDDLGRPPRLRLLFDAYHVLAEGCDVVAEYRACSDLVGHVQVADAPGRHEPGTGTLDAAAFLAAVHESGYHGWIGLEYAPRNGLDEGFAWLDDIGRWVAVPQQVS